jgi:hypothetical protein
VTPYRSQNGHNGDDCTGRPHDDDAERGLAEPSGWRGRGKGRRFANSNALSARNPSNSWTRASSLVVGGCERVAMRVALGAAAFVTVSVPACVEAARPWRGPIVDVETQEPLEGVVVLAYARRSHSPLD